MGSPSALPDLDPARLLAGVPALVAGVSVAAWLSADGEVDEIGFPEARTRLAGGPPPLVLHARALARKLDLPGLPALDLLELLAFVRPAEPCVPTPRGLARHLGLPIPHDAIGEAVLLQDAAAQLLRELAATPDGDAAAIAETMARAGWPWGPAVTAALGRAGRAETGWQVWRSLPEISEHAPPPPAGNKPVDPAEARRRLAQLLGRDAEARPSQADYAAAVAAAFAPRAAPDQPQAVLAEAGTGVGKTLGYLAPATLWAEQNQGPVWVSTYTRNLQHQIDAELDRVYPDAAVKRLKAVLRKGRENYLCLLNLEEAVRGLATRPADAVWLGLVARWARRTRDGDFSGGDFPGWLPDLAGRGRTFGLADRRGECIYAACPHFDKCFIERSVRRARRADIVVANHALVMIQAAIAGDDDAVPSRLVFDEGHHLFEAADSAFSSHLSGAEGEDLRRWLLGPEGGSRSRARGLKRRLEDLVEGDDHLVRLLTEALQAARALPGESWGARVADSRPSGPIERFLERVHAQVLARTDGVGDGHARETDLDPPVAGLVEAGADAGQALGAIRRPLMALRTRLLAQLDDEADELDSATRQRIEAIGRSLNRRAILPLQGWEAMLADLARATPPEFVDWLAVENAGRRDMEVGMHRRWVDPTRPFAAAVATPAHGLLVTSATLTDGTGDTERDWLSAELRAGAPHLAAPPMRVAVPSPFDYAAQTRVFVITDVRRDDPAQVAAAYRSLFLAAGGGALGLFTAIGRLRQVHARIAPAMDQAGLPLLAQHVDAMETTALIDIFRAEEDACLLGTDAVRDGVDVPGRSLRLIVFDRVPWPRPDILHRARRAAFGGTGYDDMLTRLKLRQAFGRLVRRASDTGVFVMLDSRLPSRLLGAFPAGAPVARVGLAEAVAETRAFMAATAP